MKKELGNKVFVIFMLAFGVFAMLELAFYFTNNTFSRYRSSGSGETAVATAVPIVNDTVEIITVPLSSMVPGATETYQFSVKNYDDDDNVTDATMKYNVKIEGAGYLPLEYSLTNDNSNVLLTDGVSPWYSLPHTVATIHNYELTISWPIEYNEFTYANLVEVVTITIDAEQVV